MSVNSVDSIAVDGQVKRDAFISLLKRIVGHRHVLTTEKATRPYRHGFRAGCGDVAAVVRPGTLLEQWEVLRACNAENLIVIAQASNTGLTGGSTPDGSNYDREVVIVSMRRLNRVFIIDGGRQVICLPGATLDHLERALKPLGREPHSVIGSSCIGASVIGGVCNNSGGALVQRGPTYTELSAFARVDREGRLEFVSHLGVELEGSTEEFLTRLDSGDFDESNIVHGSGAASDRHYGDHVRDIDADTPARFNADPGRLYEASGSAGKVMVFAVRLDTFPIERGAKVFYIGTNEPQELSDIRRHVLGSFEILPISGEYLHRDAFDIAAKYGKDMFLLINYLGTARIPKLFNLKCRVDSLLSRLPFVPSNPSDFMMQAASRLFPSHLPDRLLEYRDRYEHHLMLKVSGKAVNEARDFLIRYFSEASGDFFECTDEEGAKAFLHRFAAAGAAVRYRSIHTAQVEDIVALDVALKRNDRNWLEKLPRELEDRIEKKLYYGHFLCHVFHQDYIVKKGNDCLALEHQMWDLLDSRGAEYPAEHNVGNLYHAKQSLAEFYRELDPCNCFNAGIGHMSKFSHYRDAPESAGCDPDLEETTVHATH